MDIRGIIIILFFNIKLDNIFGYVDDEYFLPCYVIKKSSSGYYQLKGRMKSYKATCKEQNRTDLYENIQEDQFTRFCVNVTTGEPLLNTVKRKEFPLNCQPAKFIMNLAITNSNKSIETFDLVDIRYHFREMGFISVSRLRVIANQAGPKSWQMFTYQLISVGENSKMEQVLSDTIQEGRLGRLTFNSKYSHYKAYRNLPDPPPVPYDPLKQAKRKEKKLLQNSNLPEENSEFNRKPNPETDPIVTNRSSGYVAGVVFIILGIFILSGLIVFYCIYRLRKKDEGSYSLNRVMLTTNKVDHSNHYGNSAGGEHDNQFVMLYNNKEYFA